MPGAHETPVSMLGDAVVPQLMGNDNPKVFQVAATGTVGPNLHALAAVMRINGAGIAFGTIFRVLHLKAAKDQLDVAPARRRDFFGAPADLVTPGISCGTNDFLLFDRKPISDRKRARRLPRRAPEKNKR